MIDHDKWTAACKVADERMKQNEGHSYLTILKTRCQYCGRSPRQKGKCSGWFMSFLNHLYDVLNEQETSS